MRGYHLRVTLLTLGVLLGYGSAIARYGFGYCLRHDRHHHYAHHDHCDSHDHKHKHARARAEGAAE